MAETRLYRGQCPHGSWWVLADADVDSWPVSCASGCVLILYTIEPRENGSEA